MRVLWMITIVALVQLNAIAAEGDQSRKPEASVALLKASPEPYEGGGVILNGRYIAPPYQIVAVNEGIELNGHFVPEAGFNERSRRRRDDPNNVPFADRIRNRLNDRSWLLGWEGGEYGMLNESRISDVMYAILSGADQVDQLDQLESLDTSWIERSEWRQLVEYCELPIGIRDDYIPTADTTSPVDQVLAASIAAPFQRFQLSIYVLTVFGISATVFALGTLLSYRPVSKMPWSDVNLTEDAMQLVLRSVALLVGLAVLDLLCTTISARTASFWELNPLGAAFLHSPIVLGAFKLGATLLSGAILLSLRRYHGAQVASWWLALFCTVLAIRWVTFNSMFLA